MDWSDLFLRTAALVGIAMFSVWLLSLVLRDVSIVDIAWGLGFVLIGWASYLSVGQGSGRGLLITVLVSIWGLRLGGYLLWRNWGSGEDYRYVAMRERLGNAFPWVSLVTVFGLQGVVMWFVSLPVQLGQISAQPEQWQLLDALGAGVWLAGFGFETIGDYQLARFKADPSNAGRVMDRGLWGLTRHPNYFGDFLVWWGLFLVALGTPLGLWSLIGPIVMSFFLIRVSGVAMLERTISRRRPGYAEYVARTPAFFPRIWPRKS